MDLGNLIRKELERQGHNASWLAKQIPCERSNVYSIFRRKSINVGLLYSISTILGHDFFADLSEEWKKGR